MSRTLTFIVAAVCALSVGGARAQEVTGSLIGTVEDAQGGVIQGAVVASNHRPSIDGSHILRTGERGQLRFPMLPPGTYSLDVEGDGFAPYHEQGIRIGLGATIEGRVVLTVANREESAMVQGAGSHLEARGSGFETRVGPEDLRSTPTRRVSMFDFIRAAPGVSPTSPGSMTTTSVSALWSGVNENAFLIDGTNFTCPCSGEARSEPGVDFIQEVQVQSVGASAEFGNIQGAVINVVTPTRGRPFPL